MTPQLWWYDAGESIANGADAYGVIKGLMEEQERRVLTRIYKSIKPLEMVVYTGEEADKNMKVGFDLFKRSVLRYIETGLLKAKLKKSSKI